MTAAFEFARRGRPISHATETDTGDLETCFTEIEVFHSFSWGWMVRVVTIASIPGLTTRTIFHPNIARSGLSFMKSVRRYWTEPPTRSNPCSNKPCTCPLTSGLNLLPEHFLPS